MTPEELRAIKEFDDQPIRLQLEYYANTTNVPPSGRGYKSLLSKALNEIRRLDSFRQLPTCAQCRKAFPIFTDAYRCADCDMYFHKHCLAQHAKDWQPSHGLGPSYRALLAEVEALRDLLKAIEFDSSGFCVACSGWMCSDAGSTRRMHTKTCPVGIALSAQEKTT